MGFNDDYVQVNQRIEAFYARYPEGSIQSEVIELTDKRVSVKAAAYRTPDDPRPGVGHSYMNIPGSTNFTRGSELENTETSAWGRAIAALGFEVKKSIASAEEVANKSADSASEDVAKGQASNSRGGLTDKQRGLLMARFKEAGLTGQQRVAFTFEVVGVGSSKQMDSEKLDKVLAALSDEKLVSRVKADVKPEEPAA